MHSLHPPGRNPAHKDVERRTRTKPQERNPTSFVIEKRFACPISPAVSREAPMLCSFGSPLCQRLI